MGQILLKERQGDIEWEPSFCMLDKLSVKILLGCFRLLLLVMVARTRIPGRRRKVRRNSAKLFVGIIGDTCGVMSTWEFGH